MKVKLSALTFVFFFPSITIHIRIRLNTAVNYSVFSQILKIHIRYSPNRNLQCHLLNMLHSLSRLLIYINTLISYISDKCGIQLITSNYKPSNNAHHITQMALTKFKPLPITSQLIVLTSAAETGEKTALHSL